MSLAWWLLIAALAVAVLGVVFWLTQQKVVPRAMLTQAKRRFHAQRERLEAKFIQLAAAHANPDAPQWTDCTFDDDVAYVRSRTTGELSAFVAVTIATEDADDAPRGAADVIGNLQAGTAVFRFDHDHWETDGRAILNLTPSEAVRHYRNDIEVVEEEFAHHI